jgi:hypothetical protein
MIPQKGGRPNSRPGTRPQSITGSSDRTYRDPRDAFAREPWWSLWNTAAARRSASPSPTKYSRSNEHNANASLRHSCDRESCRYGHPGADDLACRGASRRRPPAQPAKAIIPMEQPQPGDRWTYEIRDEITGTVTLTREFAVTEVTPTDISVRYKNLANEKQGLVVYDRSWNVIDELPWKYSPQRRRHSIAARCRQDLARSGQQHQ